MKKPLKIIPNQLSRAAMATSAARKTERAARDKAKAISEAEKPQKETAESIEKNVKSLIGEAQKSSQTKLMLSSMPGLDSLPAFHSVIAEYVALNAPPAFNFTKKLGYEFTREQAVISVGSFAWNLNGLRLRMAAARAGVSAEWEKKYINEQKYWKRQQKRMGKLLFEAADLFDSGQSDSGPYASLVKYKELGNPVAQYGVDDVDWCGADNLRRWADVVSMSPIEVVFPVARPYPTGRLFRPGNVGKRGGASNSDGALRAMAVREIAHHIPKSMFKSNGYAVIASLAGFIGVDVTRQYVSSLMKMRQT